MEIRQDFKIRASSDRVWDIIGHQYAQVGDWASNIYASRQHALVSKLPEAPCAGRICETSLGNFQETITHYSNQHKQVSYTAEGDKMPFFVKRLANNWTVTPLGDNASQVEMRMEISILPLFNLVMGPIMRKQMKAASQVVLEDLIYFAEEGIPHPRKVERQCQQKLQSA